MIIIEYNILVGGKAGEGIKQSTLLLAKLFLKYGYYCFIYNDYPSLIRGGHNYSLLRISDNPVNAPRKTADVYFLLDERSFKVHNPKDAIVFTDENVNIDKNVIKLPLTKIVLKNKGSLLMKSAGVFATIAKYFGVEFKHLEEIFKSEFKNYDKNIAIAKEIYDLITTEKILEKKQSLDLELMTGNESTALGAVKSGLDTYIAYPMTPATGILHYLAANEDKYNIQVVQPENEISVINMALGAAYGGKITMVGTSGGGFALMNEALSLAGIAEVPIVVVLSQRTGPATGVPTYTAQSELNYAIYAGHGDFSKIVIAPADAEESYKYISLALRLAWKYQVPVVYLLDKHISESYFCFRDFDLEKVSYKKWDGKGQYLRYKITEDGISPLAFPNEAIVKATSYEHDEYGITVEDAESVIKMANKRKLKDQTIRKEIKNYEMYKLFGPESDIVLVGYGSTIPVLKEVAEKYNLQVFQPIILEPAPDLSFLKDKKVIVFETTAFGQLKRWLNNLGIEVEKNILKYDGRPFFVEDIEEEIKKFE